MFKCCPGTGSGGVLFYNVVLVQVMEILCLNMLPWFRFWMYSVLTCCPGTGSGGILFLNVARAKVLEVLRSEMLLWLRFWRYCVRVLL